MRNGRVYMVFINWTLLMFLNASPVGTPSQHREPGNGKWQFVVTVLTTAQLNALIT